MSEETVAVVRACFEAWNAGRMDALRELYHSDMIMRAPPGWPEPGPFVGREAVMRQFEQLRETFEMDRLEPTRPFLEAGDRVAVTYLWQTVGHGPGTDTEMTFVATVRDGQVHYAEYFWDHGEALVALGLSE